MFAICIIPGKFIEDDRLLIIVQIILGIIIYTGGLFIFKDNFLYEFYNKYKNKHNSTNVK